MRLASIAALAVLATGCLDDKKHDWFHTDPVDTGIADYRLTQYSVYQTGVSELSSLCFNLKRDGFYAVSDEGKVFELSLDGSTRSVLYNGNAEDWEGIDTDGKTIYLMEETKSAVYTLSGGKPSKLASITIPDGGAKGKGPEGIMYANGILYVGNQAEPNRIVKYSVAEKKALPGYTDIAFVYKYISDLCYDETDNTMWIIDSKARAFYHSTLDGELLATYHIDFVEQAEALVIDHERSCAWVGCDITAKLYKIPITL